MVLSNTEEQVDGGSTEHVVRNLIMEHTIIYTSRCMHQKRRASLS
jgi:hypothetical protein